MSNVTLAIDDEILVKVRKLAVERHTTLTAMVREMLEQLATREDLRAEETIRQLKAAFDASEVRVGTVTWKRDDLHAR